jgi:hypothetical protein
MSRLARLTSTVLVLGVALAAMVSPAAAVDQVLTDGNSTATFDPSSTLGFKSWTVDSLQKLKQQWFWLSTGSGAEQALNTLTLDPPTLTDGNGDGLKDTLSLRYVATGYTVGLRFSLTGGTAGSDSANMTGQITVTNTGATPLVFHFFQYADFDLSAAADTIQITGGNTAHQSSATGHVAETIATTMPSRYQAGLRTDVSSILGSLTDSSATTLTNDAGPTVAGDAVWAFEWDTTLASGGSLVISKGMNLAPEPATLALMAVGLGLVFRKRRG